MSRGSFGRSVARAAASGGGKAYRSRAPFGWYLMMLAISVVGVSLIVYSRQERLHPHTTTKAAEGPTANDNWHVALGIDICGKMQPNLPANSNLTSTGIRTFGDGLIDISPSAVSKPASYEGAKATLSLFASSYPGMTLTRTSLKYPGQKTTYTDGTYCVKPASKHPTANQQREDEGSVFIEEWASPTATGKLVSTSDPTKLHLNNGAMVTVAFVTAGQKIPPPPSKAHLIEVLGTSATTTTTATSKSSSTTSTAGSSTTTTAKSSATTST